MLRLSHISSSFRLLEANKHKLASTSNYNIINGLNESKSRNLFRLFNNSSFILNDGGNNSNNNSNDDVTVHFIENGQRKTVKGKVGEHLLTVAHNNGIELEGACEASLACSTCHVYINKKCFDMLPEPEDEENDMLDLAFGLGPLSRLGCQVKLTKELDGIEATLPSATRNMAVDGHKPKPH